MPAKLDLQTRIQRNYAHLRPSEQLVADHLAKIDGQRLTQSITDLARVIGVSEATVSRVSRALGFHGYTDLKLSMAAASRPDGAYANLPSNLVATDDVSQIARKVASVFAERLAETERLLDRARLDRAVEAIVNARQVVFMGVGGAAAICQEAVHVLLKIGIDCVSYSDGYTQTIVASTLKPGSLLVAISHTGLTPTVVSATGMARRGGAQTIGITGDAGSALARTAELVFVTSHGEERSIPLHGDFLEGRISQLYLIDVLYIGVLFRLGETAKTNLATTTRALADHYGGPVTKETDGQP